jgi:hypothetical protein
LRYFSQIFGKKGSLLDDRKGGLMSMITVIGYAILMILVSLFGASDPHNSLEWLISANSNFDFVRIILAILLVSVVMLPLQESTQRLLLKTISIGLLGFQTGNLLMPGLYQQHGIYFGSLDILSFLETSIIAALLYARETDHETQHFLRNSVHWLLTHKKSAHAHPS